MVESLDILMSPCIVVWFSLKVWDWKINKISLRQIQIAINNTYEGEMCPSSQNFYTYKIALGKEGKKRGAGCQ